MIRCMLVCVGEIENMQGKRILVLGGTGAMGVPLVGQLANMGYQVTVTTRRERESTNTQTQYIKGNARELSFLQSLFDKEDKWDAIVDFMAYTTEEFSERVELLLSSTVQYIYISSARVYAKTDGLISEDTPRLLDITTDEDYLKTDEYALAKARQENILRNFSQKNWTIIRPSITYNDYRLQLGVLEKEHWLYRALKGRSIVFSKDIACKLTAMTSGEDVVKGIIGVIGETTALGEAFHITCPNSYEWEEILAIYVEVLEEYLGKRPNVIMTEKSTCLKTNWNIYQIVYCRYYDRTFNNSKISKYVNPNEFVDAKIGLRKCIEQFLREPKFGEVNWQLEAINDRVAKEWTPLSEIPSMKCKMKYLLCRLGMGKMLRLYSRIGRYCVRKNLFKMR